MTDDQSQSLTSDQLGNVFRSLADEYALEGADANEDTWAKIEARSGKGRALQVASAQGTRRRTPVVYGFLAAAACALAAFGVHQYMSDDGAETPFGYAVDGVAATTPATSAEQGELIASEDKPLLVEFTDETRVQLQPYSTLRVDANRKARQVTARLSQGSADFSTGEASAAKFTLKAGVYTLRPMGAKFSFGYMPQEARLDVKSEKGLIIVTDESGKEYKVEAGGKLRLPEGGVVVKKVTEAESTKPIAREQQSSSAHAAVVSPALTFKQLAAEGKFSEVVALARRRGVSNVLATAPASELQELGQAARYTGDLSLASQTWTHMTKRFSGTSALNARFFLGRLAEQQGSTSGAIAHYDAYLKGSGGGVYSAEALGRKLSLVNKSHGAQKARPIAQEYLRRFPRGPYAQTARELVGGE